MAIPETFDTRAPSNIAELAAQTNFKPTYVSLAELKKFDVVVKDFASSFEFAQKLYSQILLNHCLRCYYFSLLILNSGCPSATPSVPQINREELIKQVYLTCILHDLGLSTNEIATSDPSHDMAFELHGAFMAYDHLRSEYISTVKLNNSHIADITQSIVLHNIPFQGGTSSATGMLVQVSAIFDMVGYGGLGPDNDTLERIFNRDTVREIEEAFPRDGIVKFGVEYYEGNPFCLASHSPLFKGVLKVPESLADSH